MHLVLSLFPGIGLLDRAFEEEGFCVVRGPDLLWGGDIKQFHTPSGVFQGIIGGPPCQLFSALKRLNPACGEKQGNLIPEFERVVSEAEPLWFLMENVPTAPEPQIEGYDTKHFILNNRHVDAGEGFGPDQQRVRKICYGSIFDMELHIQLAALQSPSFETAVTSAHERTPVALNGSGKPKKRLTRKTPTVLAGHGPVGRGEGYEANLSLAEACRLQGLPENFLEDAPFTVHGKRKAIGNGVPLPMGRAIAKAVAAALVRANVPELIARPEARIA